METFATWLLLYCLNTIWPEPSEVESNNTSPIVLEQQTIILTENEGR
jgi:hypothetical protein